MPDPSQVEKIGDRFIVRYLDQNLILVDPGHALGLKDSTFLEDTLLDEDRVFDVIVTCVNQKLIGLMVYGLGEIKISSDELNTDTIDIQGLEGSLFLEEKTVCVIDIGQLSECLFEKKKLFQENEFEVELDKAA